MAWAFSCIYLAEPPLRLLRSANDNLRNTVSAVAVWTVEYEKYTSESKSFTESIVKIWVFTGIVPIASASISAGLNYFKYHLG